MNTGLYLIENTQTNHYYGGGAECSFSRRFAAHLKLLRSNQHFNSHLQRAWNKYGEDAFRFRILVKLEKDQVRETEQKWLDIHFGLPLCYNASKNAHCPTVPFSEDRKKKMSDLIKAAYDPTTPLGQERRRRRSLIQKERIKKLGGKKYLQKMSAASRCSPNFEKGKKKISAALKGKPKSERHRESLKAAWIERRKKGYFTRTGKWVPGVDI